MRPNQRITAAGGRTGRGFYRPTTERVVTSDFVVIDFETRSPVILSDTSVSIYACFPTTGVWCAGWAYNDEPLQIWLPGDPVPDVFHTASTFVAHNVAFEINVWRHVLTPRYGWPEVPAFEHWVCTMACAQGLALPPALDKLAAELKLDHQKGDSALAKRMARPRLPRGDEDPSKLYWDDDNQHFLQLCDYCKGDVLCEKELYLWLLHHWGETSSIVGSSPKSKTTAVSASIASYSPKPAPWAPHA
jgi:DNA polymerase